MADILDFFNNVVDPNELGINDEDEQFLAHKKFFGKKEQFSLEDFMGALGNNPLASLLFPQMMNESSEVVVNVKILEGYDGKAKIPAFAHESDACFDLFSAEEITVNPGETKLVATGLAFEILDDSIYIEIVPRSGLSAKTGLRIANSPGIIDNGYRGHVKVIVWNTGKEPYKINIGDRIAQGALKRKIFAKFVQVDELSNTDRGEGGFGSTGK